MTRRRSHFFGAQGWKGCPVVTMRIGMLVAVIALAGAGYPARSGAGEVLSPQMLQQLRQWADDGDPRMQYSYAVALKNGLGGPPDLGEAIVYFKKAAAQQHSESNYELGLICLDPDREYSNPPEALNYFLAAAGAGHAGAQYQLALLYLIGKHIPKDFPEGLKWLKKSAFQSHVKACEMMGDLYLTGSGVEPDSDLAFAWHYRAAEKGSASAMYRLGIAYQMGRGVFLDLEKAFQWFLKSAEAGGGALAEYVVGELYLRGLGVTRNKDEARRWLEKARDSGDPDAVFWLERLDSPQEPKPGWYATLAFHPSDLIDLYQKDPAAADSLFRNVRIALLPDPKARFSRTESDRQLLMTIEGKPPILLQFNNPANLDDPPYGKPVLGACAGLTGILGILTFKECVWEAI